MKFATVLDLGILGQPDSEELWSEIIDQIEIKPNMKFLNVAAGHGTEAKLLARKLVASGYYNKDEAIDAIYTLDKYNVFCNQLNMMGFKNIIEQDFLEYETDMKFDVVIGNPPYQNTHGAKRWPLWHQFLSKANELSDNVAFVVPASLVGPGAAFKDVKNNIKTLSLDVNKHFNVGSTFCYAIIDKSFDGEATIITEDKTYALDLKDKDFLPLKLNDRSFELLNKLPKEAKRIWKRGEFHTADKSWQTNTGTPVFHTNAQTLFTNKQHDNVSKIRVVVTLAGYAKFKVIHNEGCSQGTFWTEFDSIEEAQEFADKCNGEYCQEILNTFKWSGWNRNEVIEKL